MDKSRPGREARRLPLIIERPDLTHPLRRTLAVVITALAWLLWVVMWIPFVAALGRYLGYDLPTIVFPSQVSLNSFLALVDVAPYAIGAAIGVVGFSYLREKFKSRSGKTDERWRPVGMDRLATDIALDPQLLASWQAEKILYVSHGPRGRVTRASVVRPDDPR